MSSTAGDIGCCGASCWNMGRRQTDLNGFLPGGKFQKVLAERTAGGRGPGFKADLKKGVIAKRLFLAGLGKKPAPKAAYAMRSKHGQRRPSSWKYVPD